MIEVNEIDRKVDGSGNTRITYELKAAPPSQINLDLDGVVHTTRSLRFELNLRDRGWPHDAA